MTKKKAVITVELVDENIANSNEAIAQDLLKWFRDEAVPAPLVEDVKKLLFRSFKRRIGLRSLLGSTLLTRWLRSTRTAETVRACCALQILRHFLTCATLYTFNSCSGLFRERFYEGQVNIWNSECA